jgi:lysophospholipase L1-like esterase
MFDILCFGDSNTRGRNPVTGVRFSNDDRWSGVLQNTLGSEYHVIVQGLGGRTTVWADPIEGAFKNGKDYLIPCLASHQPLDLVIILLGTNDLKTRFAVSAADVALGVGVLIDIIKKSGAGRDGKAPKVLLLSPPPLGEKAESSDMFEGGREKSLRFPEHFRNITKLYNCPVFDTGTVIKSSDIDGIHWEKEEHRKLGEAVAKVVKRILK